MDCQYRKQNGDRFVCEIAMAIAPNVAPSSCTETHFIKCQECQCQFTLNYASIAVAVASIRDAEGGLSGVKIKEITSKYSEYILGRERCKSDNRLPPGPGTSLHSLLGKRGWHIEVGCKCLITILEMNTYGLEWCRANTLEIGKRMAEEWKRRHPLVGAVTPSWMNDILANEGAAIVTEALDIYELSEAKSTPKSSVVYYEWNKLDKKWIKLRDIDPEPNQALLPAGKFDGQIIEIKI